MADIGIKLGVKGEKEFKRSLSDINSQFKVLGSEMKLVSSQFDAGEKSIESYSAKNEVLGKQIETQKNKIETLKKALENASDSFGENDKRTRAWVVQLNNAEAVLNSMERELSQNEKAVDELGDEMHTAEKKTDKFGDELDKAGDEADRTAPRFEKLGSVVKGIGVAMGAALAAIGAAAVSAGKAMVDLSVEAAAYADEMITQSTVTGMSVESLQAYSYAADLVDVSLGIRSPGGKEKWTKTTVVSILRNEKYKGDARLQKKFTVDFLEKKMKPNEGEVPQYYVEDSHPHIIEPAEWDHVQAVFDRRKALGKTYSGKSVLSAKLVCEDCGGFFGSKVWHSTDKYRRTIWQCNSKFSNEHRCETPTIDTETIQRMFISAYNQLMKNEERLLATVRVCESYSRILPNWMRQLTVRWKKHRWSLNWSKQRSKRMLPRHSHRKPTSINTKA